MGAALYDGVAWYCEVGFDHGPSVTSPTWTDVTADVMSVSIKGGGISGDFGDFDAGSATVVLGNDGDSLRRYDPTYAAGPYFGRLLPGRQIRIYAVVPGPTTTYHLFRGVIEGWPQRWQQPSSGAVTVTARDMTGVLAQTPHDPDYIVSGQFDTSSAIASMLMQAAWPTGLQELGLNASAVVDTTVITGSIVDAMRTAARTEQGRLYVDGTGKVVFRTLTWCLTDPITTTSAATWGDGPSDLPLGSDFDLEDGGRWIYNAVTCQGATATDATSQGKYLTRGLSLAMAHPEGSAGPASYATWILGRAKEPHPRPGPLVIRPRMDTTQSLVPRAGFNGLFHALGYQPGQRLTVARRPSNTAVITLPFLIERISHDFNGVDWVMTIEPGPVTNVNGEAYARWDTSTWDGTHVWAP